MSLLKILLSNDCIFTCAYCPNAKNCDTERASATPDEICELTINFYKRNFIEGLFLSSAVKDSPDKTMELLYLTVKKLRTEYNFNGYIHLKGIPHAYKLLVEKASKYVDRMSFNIELPSEKSLKLLAPQKSKESVLRPIRELNVSKNEAMDFTGKHKILPAGQTTQLIVGASPESDGEILTLSQNLYTKLKLKRVYYSGYIPVVKNPLLPDKNASMLREHRLYQADWLMRFYGFTSDEIAQNGENLPEEYDPKCNWALKNMQLFPMEINTAPLEMLLRIPGVGLKSAYKIMNARKYSKLSFEDLIKMKVVLKRARHFITCNGKFFGIENFNSVKHILAISGNEQSNTQLSLFSTKETALSALTGEL